MRTVFDSATNARSGGDDDDEDDTHASTRFKAFIYTPTVLCAHTLKHTHCRNPVEWEANRKAEMEAEKEQQRSGRVVSAHTHTHAFIGGDDEAISAAREAACVSTYTQETSLHAATPS